MRKLIENCIAIQHSYLFERLINRLKTVYIEKNRQIDYSFREKENSQRKE